MRILGPLATLGVLALALAGCTTALPAGPDDAANSLFFLHHSVGAGVIEGGVRAWIAGYNATNATAFSFWDHSYSAEGLFDAAGARLGTSYGPATDNTDPGGLRELWTGGGGDEVRAREAILNHYRVIAFKSCFTATAEVDAPRLAQYREDYLAMRDMFDTRLDRMFVVVTPPPNVPASSDPVSAAHSREFAEWLASDDYLAGHPNVRCFDLFDRLAQPDGLDADFLRPEYRQEPDGGDAHPNETANLAVAPEFAQFLVEVASGA